MRMDQFDLAILDALQHDGALTNAALGEIVHLSASQCSRRRAALEQAGLIRSRKQSRHVFYSADLAGIGGVISYLLADCCMDHPEVLACCGASARYALHRVAEGDFSPQGAELTDPES